MNIDSDGVKRLSVELCTLRAMGHSPVKRRRRVRLYNQEYLMKKTEWAVFLCPCPVAQNLLLSFLPDFSKSRREIARLDDHFDFLPIAVQSKL
jgi:hypothetical protein